MKDEIRPAYKYDRCSSRGICSINPATASLQEVIILYLRRAAFYELKLRESGCGDTRITNLILNTISILSSDYEISETNFKMINSAFRTKLPEIIKIYKEKCKSSDITSDMQEAALLASENLNINEYIRFGEQEFSRRIKDISEEVRTYYKILFLLVKSVCINLLTAESYNAETQNEILLVLKVLNTLNFPETNGEELKKLIAETSGMDCDLAEKISLLQEKYYGKTSAREVSYSTVKGKAVLVVGSNIRELEQILDKFNNTGIDVYTHDNMVAAHTFPKFREYKHLKGQYGQGIENCLLDFSTFPGPIILTRHSLFNVESLYRGRLYTTDFAFSKGVIRIENNDFSGVIKSAAESKGFKTGRKCDSAVIGYEYESVINQIDDSLKNGGITDVFVIGIKSHSYNEEYYKELIEHMPKNVLIISLACCQSGDNLICLNTDYDNYAMYKITKYLLKNYQHKISVFIPFCDRHTLSFIINLSRKKRCGIYLGEQNNSVINPIVINGLKRGFGVTESSLPKKDLEEILNLK